MRVMALDCEFNQPSKKTIQIGAAVYDVRTGALVDTFDMFVNPQEAITPFITELTTITDKDVENAPLIGEAFLKLKDFHEQNGVFMNPLVWGSGTSNDSLALYNEAYLTKEERAANPNFMGYRVIDAKTLYQSLMMFQNSKIKGGLSASCEKLGIGFEGRNHIALTDAKNTFRLWHYLMIRFNLGFNEKKLK